MFIPQQNRLGCEDVKRGKSWFKCELHSLTIIKLFHDPVLVGNGDNSYYVGMFININALQIGKF